MLESTIRESPLLAAIAGTVLAALAILLVGAIISSRMDRRRRATARRDPGFDHDPVDLPGLRALEGPGVDREPSQGPRRGFGFGALTAAFLIGLVGGAAGIVISSKGLTTAVGTLAELIDIGPGNGPDKTQPDGSGGMDTVATPGIADPASAPEVAETTTPAGAAIPADVRTKLEAFAQGLKGNLPRAAGPELSLTRVDIEGMTLNLGYSVGRVMDEVETEAFDGYIMRTVKSLFCGKESREIRFLNENGVAFEMEYTDPRGKTVTKLTIAPHFCA